MDDRTFYILISLAIALYVGLFIYTRRKKKRRALKNVKRVASQKWLNGLYKFYISSPFKKIFDKLLRRTMLLYPTDITDVNTRVTINMTKGLGVAVLCVGLTLISARGSIFYICSGLTATYIFFTQYMNMSFEKTDVLLLSQFRTFISNVRHNYYISSKRIDDAVYMTIDESEYEMSLHAEKVYDILKSVDIMKEADKYIPLAPNRFFLLFIAICTAVGIKGDKELEKGKSVLLNNLTYLKKEVAIELQKIRRNTVMFSGYVFVCILPLFLIKPIELWADKNFPELSEYYHGFYGIVCTVFIFIAVLICYTLVMNLKNVMQREVKEHPFLQRLSKVKFVNKILTYQTSINYSNSERINDKLKLTGERIGTKQFLLKRMIISIATFILFQVLMFGGIYQQQKYLMKDFSQQMLTSYVSDDEMKESMEEFGKYYMEKYKESGVALNRDDLIQEIREDTTIHKQKYAEMLADQVILKIQKYANAYYKWWYLIISFIASVVAYYIPLWILDNRIKSMKMNMEDEVNQFQTLVMMLMHADGMTIGTILEWMERFSNCFRESISTCINELPKGEEQALKKLRDTETFEPFRRFVNNMLIVNKQGLIAAFDEIVTDKELTSDERKEENEEIQKKKSSKGALISVLPSIALIGLLVIYPFLAMSNSTLNSINSLDSGTNIESIK